MYHLVPATFDLPNVHEYAAPDQLGRALDVHEMSDDALTAYERDIDSLVEDVTKAARVERAAVAAERRKRGLAA